MKKNLTLALFLGIVSAVAGLVIGLFNGITAPIIAENDIAAENANMEKLFPNGEFSLIDYSDPNKVILSVYEAKGEGYVIKATATGYNSSTPIIVLVGLDREGKTIGIETLQQQETNGFGAGCFTRSFLDSTYVNKTSADKIDALSGATKTSNAMRRIMNAVFKAYEEVR